MIKIFDLHCDTAQNIFKGEDLSKKTKYHVDIPKLREGGIAGVVFACWVSPLARKPFYRAMELIDRTLTFVAKNRKYLNLARNYRELREDKINIILGVEGGHIFDEKVIQFKTLYRLGVRVFTLTWNNSNRLAHSALVNDNSGLTRLGREYLRLMDRTGVIVDLSHASTKTVTETCNILTIPPLASHSCVRSVNNIPRNISDGAIKAIARKGGVCGVNFSQHHLGSHAVVRHIKHIKKLTSINNVALGSDFDGIHDPVLPNIAFSQKLYKELDQTGFSRKEIEKIFFKNFLRVFRSVC